MVKSFRVTGLWGRQDYAFEFHEDLNIFTGSNGSGKTTLLKLMWYMMSGHIRQALAEIEFSEAELVTASAFVRLVKRPAKPTGRFQDKHPRDKSPIEPDTPVAEVHMKREPDGVNIFSLFPIPMRELNFMVNAEGPARREPSLFFPTFRRVEGGFSLDEGEEKLRIVEGFKDYSKRMTHINHRFVAFADFDDVRGLVNEISSDIRAKLEPDEKRFTDFLTMGTNGTTPPDFTARLKANLEALERRRREIGRPLEIFNEYVDAYFLEKSVRVTDDGLVLGTHSNQIPIERLSAGEKNFLSLLVYAVANPDATMFIDEPELTLHIDWQRELLSIIRHIAPGVQVFVATHSPAIYSTFPDRDFWLDTQIEEEVNA